MNEMSAEIIVAILAFCGTLIGAFSANKLVIYRIDQLENKVNKHNQLIERMYEAEKNIKVHDEKISVANHRIDDLEAQHT